MSPILNRENVPIGVHKFVREGEQVAYEPTWKGHDQIAKTYFPNSEIEPLSEKRVIDDGGYIGIGKEDILRIDGTTTTCRLRGNPTLAREETVAIVRNIVDIPVGTFDI